MAAKLFNVGINLNQNELQNAVIHVLSTDPLVANLVAGQFFYNSTDKVLRYFDGTNIMTVATGSDTSEMVTRSATAASAGIMMVSAGADRTAQDYAGGAGIIKSDANGVVSAATEGTDYLTATSTNTLTNKSFDANGTGNSLSNVELADFASSAIATDLASDSNLDTKLARADAIKSYADSLIAAMGTLVGAFDASSGNLPTAGSGASGAIVKGDYWRVSVAGDITGLGHLEIGDMLVASEDGADAANEFFVIQANITDAVTTSSASSVDNALVRMDGTNGHIVQTSLATMDDNGSINLPAGEAYKVNGTDIMTAVPHKYAAAFNADSDWTGAAAPFTITVAAATHGLGATQDIQVQILETTNNTVVECDVSIAASGAVTITSNSKFAGRYVLIG